MTVRQFQPSDANSMEFRAAFVYNSNAEDQRRSLTRSGYSVLDGICTTDTDLLSDTRRFFLASLVLPFIRSLSLCLLERSIDGVIWTK